MLVGGGLVRALGGVAVLLTVGAATVVVVTSDPPGELLTFALAALAAAATARAFAGAEVTAAMGFEGAVCGITNLVTANTAARASTAVTTMTTTRFFGVTWRPRLSLSG